MKLMELHVMRGYGYPHDVDHPLQGKVKFLSNAQVETTFPVSEELSLKIIELCAGALVEGAKELAQKLTAEVLTQAPQITSAPLSPD